MNLSVEIVEKLGKKISKNKIKIVPTGFEIPKELELKIVLEEEKCQEKN